MTATDYQRAIEPIVLADPEVIAAATKVERLEKELLTAKVNLANAKSAAIARAGA